MEVRINRKQVIVIVTVAAVLSGIAAWLGTAPISIGPTSIPHPISRAPTTFEPPTGPVANTPQDATAAFAEAFYVVNYDDYNGWLAELKAVSTTEGFAILTKSVVPVVWPALEKAKTNTPAEAVTAEDAGLIAEGDSQLGGPWQIRKVSIHVDPAHLWPTMKSGDFSALVMIARQAAEWRFVSFMTQDQIDQIQKGQKP